MQDHADLHKDMLCPHCGSRIENHRFIKRADGSARCEHCYFENTYLQGIAQQIEASYLVTLEALVSTIDAREHETGSHSLRVTQFALIIGHSYGISGRDLVDLYAGGLLHDIGKIGVPDAVLLKKGPLLSEEKTTMNGHPEIGYSIISRIGYFANSAEIVRSHHEHFDGSGYPRGLKGSDIPLGARIFAVADGLDALTVKRPYREPLSFEDAQQEIQKASGTIYDPAVISAFLNAGNELREYVGKVLY